MTEEQILLIAKAIAWGEGEDITAPRDWTLWLDAAQQFLEDLEVSV